MKIVNKKSIIIDNGTYFKESLLNDPPKNYEVFRNRLNHALNILKTELELTILQGKEYKISDSDDLLLIITQFFPIKRYISKLKSKDKNIDINLSNDSISVSFYVKDFKISKPNFAYYQRADIDNIATQIADIITIKQLRNLIAEIQIRSRLTSWLEDINLPPNDVIAFKNKIIDIKTREFIKDNNYDFIFYIPYNKKRLDEVNPEKLQIIKTVFDQWSNNDPDSLEYLLQLVHAGMDGNGRGVYHIIKGPGGNGKSTFINILSKIAGENYTVLMDLHDITNDNIVGQINESTKLIAGHDLATNTKLTSKAISRFKVLVTNDGIVVDQKYKAPVVCQSPGLKIQSTNTDITIFENSKATQRRLRLFDWTKLVFTDEEQSFDLAHLLETDDEIYECLIAYTLDKIPYFDKFKEIQAITDATNNMINAGDPIFHFLTWYKEQELDTMPYIPTSSMYQLYKFYLNQENPGSTPLKSLTFSKKLYTYQEQFGFEINNNQTRIGSKKLYEYNEDFLNNEIITDKRFKIETPNRAKLRFLKFKNSQIDETHIKKMEDRLENNLIASLDQLTFKEYLILLYLQSKNNIKAIELLMDEN